MKSTMAHQFSKAPSADILRSSFDRSHGHKTTFDAGKLIPIYCDEVLPGDTFNMDSSFFARMATPINPIMDNLYLDVHYFFVPNRLLWDNWRRFMGERDDPSDSIDYTVPVANVTGGVATGSLMDYLGIPVGFIGNVNLLPIRAYFRIFNEWYRDQNLVNSNGNGTRTNDGPESTTDGFSVQRRGKRHDYFTSALTSPQKGDAPTIGIGGLAPVSVADASTASGNAVSIQDRSLSAPVMLRADGTYLDYTNTGPLSIGDPINYLQANLTDATQVTINQIREAFQIQKLLEKDARGGTRYSELINQHFGVEFYDVSYRPEYLGGSSTPVNINPIAQTSSTDATTPQGNMSAFATAGGRAKFTKSFVEHGYVMGIASVRADLTYQQGIEKHFLRSTRYDYFWPSLAQIGEQPVLNKEIYYQGTSQDDDVFGYQERYAEYRYKPSQVTGLFRSDAAGSLDSWHLAQDFGSLPTLGTTFIQETPPMDRILALPSEPDFIFDSYFNLRCARPMPLYGIPGNMDRF
jgi:hypothetical protein